MATDIPVQHKRSSTSGNIPTAGQMQIGEIAVNLADKKLFTKDTSNNIIELGKAPTGSNGITVTGHDIAMSGAYTGNFTVTGAITATGDITAFSDERLKSDINTLDGSKVYEMRGVSYTKDDEAGSGVIAQELQKVAPELVHTHEDGYLSVAYGNVVGYLIEAIKDLQKQIDQLNS